MRVHFVGDLEGNKSDYKKICDYIEEFGFNLITRHSINMKYGEVKKETPEETELYVKKMQSWIKKADIVVFENTYLGFGCGFESALALKYGKQVILLYKPNGNNTPFPARGINMDQLQVLTYNDKTLKEILKYALEYASEQIDKRFTLLMPNDIMIFLDEIAGKGESRSEFIRNLIRERMKKKGEA